MNMLKISFCSLFFASSVAWAGSCCLSSSQTPSLLLGTEKAKFSFSSAQGTELYRAGSDGVWTVTSQRSQLWTNRVDGAYRWAQEGDELFQTPHFQMGLSIPYVTLQDGRDGDSHLGDLKLSVGYGTSSDLVFAVVTAPTGRSIYKEIADSGLYTGQGFYRLGLGLLSARQFGWWDVSGSFSVSDGLARETLYGKADPGLALQADGSLGVRSSQGGLGLALSQSFDPGLFEQGEKRVTSAGVYGRWVVSDQEVILVTYSDQTLLGKATNTALQRSFAVGFSKLWR
jgi:hypothetical protein